MQGFTGTEAVPKDSRNISGIVRELIQKLNNVVKKAFDDAVSKLEGMKEALKNFTFAILAKVQQHIQDVVDDVFAQFGKLKEYAVAFGVDVSDCIDDSEQDIKLIAGQIFFDTTTCVTKKMFKAFDILDDSMAAIKAVIKDVSDLEKKFEQCEDSLCYLKASAQVTGFIASLPVRIAKLTMSTHKTIIQIQLEITFCEAEKLSELKTILLPAIEKVNLCIANKIKGIEEVGENEEKKLFLH